MEMFHSELASDADSECEENSSKFCQTCLANNDSQSLKDMFKKNDYQSSKEIYSRMMDYCFAIQIGENTEAKVPENYLICEPCIKRLREAVIFRLQVEEAQKTIKKWLNMKRKSSSTFIGFGMFDQDVQSTDSELSGSEGGFFSLMNIKRSCLPTQASIRVPLKYKKIVIKNGHRRRRKAKILNPLSMSIGSNKTTKGAHSLSKGKRKNIFDETPNENEDLAANMESEPREYEKIYVNRKPAIGYFDLPYVLERNQLQCKICDEVFPTHTGLKIHMPRHFPNYTCEHCGRGFANRNQLRNHSLIHLPKKFECPKCPGMLFRTKSYRTDHMKKKHSATRYFIKCVHCDARFLNHTTRQHHLVKVHGHVQRQYKCKHCEKIFTSAGSRSVHFRKIHLNKRDAKCSTCGKEFFEKRDLAMHMLTHTRIRNFTCSVCGKAYLRQYALNVHMNVHTGEKKHVCEVCSKAFAHKSSLEGHMAVHERDWRQ